MILGNPPFGHSGEKAIGEYFKTERANNLRSPIPKGISDIIDFEGMPMVQLLTETRKGVDGGLRLSYCNFGFAFINIQKNPYQKPTKLLRDKKILVFFQQDVAPLGGGRLNWGFGTKGPWKGVGFWQTPLTF